MAAKLSIRSVLKLQECNYCTENNVTELCKITIGVVADVSVVFSSFGHDRGMSRGRSRENLY